jgi:hypothetical protein
MLAESTALELLLLLPLLQPRRDHEIVGRAAVGFRDELQRLDEGDFDVLLLDQRRERLGGDFFGLLSRICG